MVKGAHTRGTIQQCGGVSGSGRDPGGLQAGAPHMDEQRLACAIQRGRTGTHKGLVPLMAELQQHKSKVRPVMDFRQLNYHVDVFTVNADVCTAKLREWRQKGSNVSLLDLKRAYIQVRVQKTLRPFQAVKIGGQRYCLTCLEFGLNVAPHIMKAIVSAVLLQEEAVGHAASAYINDIYVNEDVILANRVREHLARFGLECKDPERLEDGPRVLGLAVAMNHGKLRRM